MANPFQELQTALSNATGLDFTLAGILLGGVLTVTLLIMLTWVLDPKSSKGRGDVTFMISAGIGIAISTGVGWFPIWIPIFLGLIIAFVVIDPFGNERG